MELYLHPSPELKYSISVHDPQFFWQTYNGLTIPQATTSLERGDTYLVVAATEYEELDRPGSRCQQESSYSFTACVRVSHSQSQSQSQGQSQSQSQSQHTDSLSLSRLD